MRKEIALRKLSGLLEHWSQGLQARYSELVNLNFPFSRKKNKATASYV